MKKIKNKIKKIKTFCFDIDGVICNTKENYYYRSKPIKKAINKINELYSKGNIVIIFTARFMGRSNENVNIAKKRAYQLTYKQLKDWNVKYHRLIVGKPSFDYIVDDKSVDFRKDWYKFI